MASKKEQNTTSLDTGKNIFKRLLQVFVSIIFIAVILFASAGSIKWVYGWVLIVASIVVIVANSLIFPAELIAERGRKKENVEKWDKIISRLIIIPWSALYLIAGLDIRLGWTPQMEIWGHMAGLVFFFLGNALVSWAMVSNLYFSTAVRIQYERGHTVATGGPYRYVRHPGYSGIIIFNFSVPFILGSVWALIPAGLTAVLFIIRTVMEDETLKNKLEGYRDYAERVKYRLVPGIW